MSFRRAFAVGTVAWCSAFGAHACAWEITGGTGAAVVDIGYVYPYSGDAFCAQSHLDLSADSTANVCTQTGASVAASGVYEGEPWTYVITGTGTGCAPDEPDEEGGTWSEVDLMHAIVGVLWFFALMHGFTVGRSST